MTTVYPLIQIISHIFVVPPTFAPWQTCAQNLIERYRPSSVFFNCKSQLCPNNIFYKTLQVPSQTMFGLQSSELPTFKETDLVFFMDDRLDLWNNETVHKYRRKGGSDFKIVIVANMHDNMKDLSKSMEGLFLSMWLSGIVSCAVLVMNDTESQIYSYIPFKDSHSCEDTTPVFLGECSEVLDEVFDLTYKTINLNQCPLRLAAVDDLPFFSITFFDLGRFGKLVTEVARRMNASIQFMRPASGGQGESCGPKEASGTRGMVMNGEAHMAAGSFNQQECSTLEYVSIAFTQCLTWCTPLLSNNNDIFLLTVKPFQTKVWIALIISAIVVSVMVSYLSAATSKRWTSKDVFNLALVIYAQPPLVKPRTASVRLVVTVWLLACLVLRTAHEGELKSRSSLRRSFHIIQESTELVNTDIRLCSTATNLQSLVWLKENPVVRKTIQKSTYCNGTLLENMIAAAKLRDRAVFTSDLRCVLVASHLWPQNLYLYPRTGGCFKLYQVSPIITLPGSPFKQRWRLIQDRCTQAGLFFKWLDAAFLRKPSGEARPYTIRHLLPALFALGVGSLFALVLFAFEKTYHRRTHFKLKCNVLF